MAVESTYEPAKYNCDGAIVNFTFIFPITREEDIVVILRDADGNETVLTLTTDYTVTGTGASWADGGYITTVATYAAGNTITILRSVEKTQETDYVENDTFPAESHEDALDRDMMAIQELEEIISRCIKMPASDSGVLISELPTGDLTAGRRIALDDSGNVTVVDPAPVCTCETTVLLGYNGLSLSNWDSEAVPLVKGTVEVGGNMYQFDDWQAIAGAPTDVSINFIKATIVGDTLSFSWDDTEPVWDEDKVGHYIVAARAVAGCWYETAGTKYKKKFLLFDRDSIRDETMIIPLGGFYLDPTVVFYTPATGVITIELTATAAHRAFFNLDSLPDGAFVTKLLVDINVFDDQVNANIYLVRVVDSSDDIMANIAVTGAAYQVWRSKDDDSVSNPFVEKDNYSYGVQLEPGHFGFEPGGSSYVRDITIEYTVYGDRRPGG